MVAARCLSLTFGPSSLIYQPIGRYLTEAEGRCYLSDIIPRNVSSDLLGPPLRVRARVSSPSEFLRRP